MLSSENNFMNIFTPNKSKTVDMNLSSLPSNQNINGFISLKLQKLLEFMLLNNENNCKISDDNVENIETNMKRRME
jgi:hypothetical protein